MEVKRPERPIDAQHTIKCFLNPMTCHVETYVSVELVVSEGEGRS